MDLSLVPSTHVRVAHNFQLQLQGNLTCNLKGACTQTHRYTCTHIFKKKSEKISVERYM